EGTAGVLVEAVHTPTPIATIAAAMAYSVILCIRIPPRARGSSSHLCGMPDLGPDLCDGHHTLVERLRRAISIERTPTMGEIMRVRRCTLPVAPGKGAHHIKLPANHLFLNATN